MTAQEIVKQIVGNKSIYGRCASMYVDDEKLSKQFISEILEQIKNNKIICEETFGVDVVKQIIEYDFR